MKRILFIFLLSPVFLAAQESREILSDTLYIQRGPNSAGDTIFFEVRTVVYDDMEEQTTRKPIGDTATVVNYLAGRVVQNSRDLARSATQVIRQSEIIRAINNDEDAALAAGLPDLDAVIQQFFEPALIGDWTVIIPGRGNYAGAVTKNAQGALRLKIDDATTRGVRVMGDGLLRVSNFPADQPTYLYKVNENIYSSIDRSIILRKARAAQNARK